MGKSQPFVKKPSPSGSLFSWTVHLKGTYFHATSYLNRRQSVITTHSNYVVRAGRKQKAISDLRSRFALKYIPLDLDPLDLPSQVLCSQNQTLQATFLITVQEITDVLNLCRRANLVAKMVFRLNSCLP